MEKKIILKPSSPLRRPERGKKGRKEERGGAGCSQEGQTIPLCRGKEKREKEEYPVPTPFNSMGKGRRKRRRKKKSGPRRGPTTLFRRHLSSRKKKKRKDRRGVRPRTVCLSVLLAVQGKREGGREDEQGWGRIWEVAGIV